MTIDDAATPRSAIAGDILAAARTWIGTPYRHQGARKGVGCDCIGLVTGIWREVCGPLPERPGAYSPDWAEGAADERLLSAARRHLDAILDGAPRPGDLLVFRWRPGAPAKHVGIKAEGCLFIHAYEGMAVSLSPFVPQWRRRLAGVFAFPPRNPGATR